MMNELKMVIFDVDGTLLNTEFLWEKAWADIAEKYHVPQFSAVFHKVVGISGSDVTKVLDENLGDIENREELLDAARKLGTKYLDENIELMPGVLELLDTLEKLHIRKAVATTTNREATMKRLTKMGIIDRFEYILCGDEVSKRKPSPEIYLKVLKAVHCDPENVLVLEDTGYGVQSAYEANAKVIMIPSINPPKDIDRENAYKIVNSLYDVQKMIEES